MLPSSSPLRMKAVCSPETPVITCKTKCGHKPKDHNVNSHCLENLKSEVGLEPDCIIVISSRRTISNSTTEEHLPPHKFGHPSYWYDQLWEIKKYEFGVASSGVTSIKILCELHSAVLELLYVYRRTSLMMSS
jgi:hypothetical protein